METSTSMLGRHFMMEVLITRHERRLSQLDALNEMPLFPTKQMIWHENTPRKCQASREAAAARGAWRDKVQVRCPGGAGVTGLIFWINTQRDQ